jgi:hypothetical protein
MSTLAVLSTLEDAQKPKRLKLTSLDSQGAQNVYCDPMFGVFGKRKYWIFPYGAFSWNGYCMRERVKSAEKYAKFF